MRLPISWLAEYIDISDMSVEDLANKITFAGIEIEGIEQVGPSLDGIVAAEIRECMPHPDSDHLHIAKVFDGQNELQIVCGAPNCRNGMISALARIGAVIPNGGFKIKKGKLRGVESFGMLCSARELSLSDDGSGIMELPEGTKPGTPLANLFGSCETVFEVEVTWNRPDCLSIIGVAREFAAILGRPLKMPAIDFPETEVPASSLCSVQVKNKSACPDYTARVLPHVERRPSPDWMRKRLELCGQRSIDIVVDVSNYVMLECGQPLHTFDYECVAGHGIIVRNAGDGEKIRTLDGCERTLDSTMLVIADKETPLAVAGVMGGEGSEIRPGTTSVLLESASFCAPSIKSTATRLGMHTEASHRYERGVDPFLTDWASRRACHLLAAYANATVASGSVSDDSRSPDPLKVKLRFKRACDVIGMAIPPEKQISILESLSFRKVDETEDCAVFTVPSFRVDVDCEADLIEEIARMSGLDSLPEIVPSSTIVAGANDSSVRSVSVCRNTLVQLGFTEAMNYSFTSPSVLDAFSTSNRSMRMPLPNPVSAEYSVMRDSLIPQMISTMAYNHAHETSTASMFEIGRVFFKNQSGVYEEEDRICIALMGFAGRSMIDRTRPVSCRESILWLKGALESLAWKLRTPQLRFVSKDIEGFEKGFSAEVFIAGRPAGVIGIIDSAVRKKCRIQSPLSVVELKRAPLLSNVFKTVTAKDVPAYPSTSRDIALISEAGVSNEAILQIIKKAAPRELVGVKLFDIFTGAPLGEGKTSVAYSLEYRSSERTLNDDEVNAFHEKIKDALKSKLHVEIRES